jgi:hypothetical protein
MATTKKFSELFNKGDNTISRPTEQCPDEPDAVVDFSKPRERKLVTNYIPPSGNRSCYDTWEFFYYKELLALRDIYANHRIEGGDEEYYFSAKFLYKFAKFIYKSSSGYISPHLEPLSEELEEDYYHYCLLKE